MILFKALVRDYDRMTPAGPVHVPAHFRSTPVMSFRSGASSPGIARGYIVSGVPFGVSMREMTPGSATWDMMVEYARRGGQVFVDTGAFTAFTKNEAMDWPKVVANYRFLIRNAEGARLHIVMPDVVGDQAASLRLLQEHRGVARDVIASGHNALVPIQKGNLPPYLAWRAAVDVLGTEDFTASVPSNAAAFTPADLADLVGGPVKPRRVHLLGIAGNKKRLAELVRIIHEGSPDTVVTSDANRLRAQVGEGRPVTMERPKQLAWMKDAFASLLDDPAQRAAFLADAERILAPAVAAGSISAVERRQEAERSSQRDLFVNP